MIPKNLPPIEFQSGEGEDDIQGTSEDPVELVVPALQTRSLYSEGSTNFPSNVTLSSLYPEPLNGARGPLLIAKTLDDALKQADYKLRPTGRGLMIVSGLISPETQQDKFKQLFFAHLGNKETPNGDKIMQAAEWADTFGSIAKVEEDEAFTTELESLRADENLIKELAPWIEKGDQESVLKNYLTVLVNVGWKSNLKLKIETARTVHNWGHSANVVMTDRIGNVLPTGRAIDVPSATQRWDYFEKNGVDEFKAEIGKNPQLAQFMRENGTRPEDVNAKLIEELRDHNRALFEAVMRGGNEGKTDVYAGEGGHISIRRPEYPNKIGVDRSVANWHLDNPASPRYTLA